MTTKWLIENFEPDNKLWKLIEEVKRRGQPLEVVDYYRYQLHNSIVGPDGMPTNSSFQDNDCVIVQGSIQLAMWVRNHKPWVPGVWFEPEKFNCTYFYSYLGNFLLNKDYEFTTIGEYKRRKDEFFKRLGLQDCLFLRPNSGLKTFTGQIFKKERHETDWNYFDMSTRAEDIIVVAPPKAIEAEYRFIIGRGKIIAATMYMHEGKSRQLPGAPKEAHTFVEEVVKVIEKNCPIAPMYVVDVSRNYHREYGLLELNAFNSAGMYEADKAAIVDAANQIALEEYQEYHNV